MMLHIYATPLSANGRKVLAVCRQLELKPEVHIIDVYRGEGRTAEYLAINPTGKIPSMVDGDLTLFESNAILIYLAEAHGNHRLWARDAKARGTIARWLFWESSQWQPALSPLLAELVGHRLFPQRIPAPRTMPDWTTASLQPLLETLETTLGGHMFLAGGDLSIADFSVAGMMTYFSAARFPFEAFPALSRWYRAVEALESWRSTEAPLFSTAHMP
jgi:glutathione S-transferase